MGGAADNHNSSFYYASYRGGRQPTRGPTSRSRCRGTSQPSPREDLTARALRELRNEGAETDDEVEIVAEENPQGSHGGSLETVRAGEARAAAIRQRHAATQAQGTEIAETTFFIRDMMIRLPRSASEVPSNPPTRGLASTFLRVALEADREVRAQQAPGEKRQYPAGAMPDKSPLKRRKRVRF